MAMTALASNSWQEPTPPTMRSGRPLAFQPSTAGQQGLAVSLDVHGCTTSTVEGAVILAYSIVFDTAHLCRERRAAGKQLVCSDGLLNEITEANEMTPLMSLVWEDSDETRKESDHGEWYDSFVGYVYFKSLAEHVKHIAASPAHATLIEGLNEFAYALENARVIGARWRLAVDRRPHV